MFADVIECVQTDLEDTAQAFIDIARNSSMTGQNIIVGELRNSLRFYLVMGSDGSRRFWLE